MIPVVWFILFSIIWTSLICGAAFALTRGSVSAPFAHRLWQGAAGLTLLPWALCLVAPYFQSAPQPTPIPDSGLPYVAGVTLDAQSTNGFMLNLPSLGVVLLSVIALGWVYQAGSYVLSQYRLQRLKRQAVPQNLSAASALSQAAGLSKVPQLSATPCGSPFIAGIARKIVFIPQGMIDSEDVSAIFVHECRHAARGDLIARPIERTLCALFWFSPVMLLMQRQLDHWREAACDAEAAAALRDPVAYARALARTARTARTETTRALPVSPFIPKRNRSLALRLTHLLDQEPKHPRGRIGMICGALAIALSPIALAQVSGVSNSAPVEFTHPIVKHKYAKLTSTYGERKDPFTKRMAWHNGVDIKGKEGDLVYAPAKGVIVFADTKPGYGKTLELALADGRKLRFAQLSAYKSEVGKTVEAGTPIAKIGQSGRATGPHLHFEIWVDDKVADPMTIDGLTLIKGSEW